jgi:hypothetical protein
VGEDVPEDADAHCDGAGVTDAEDGVAEEEEGFEE